MVAHKNNTRQDKESKNTHGLQQHSISSRFILNCPPSTSAVLPQMLNKEASLEMPHVLI